MRRRVADALTPTDPAARPALTRRRPCAAARGCRAARFKAGPVVRPGESRPVSADLPQTVSSRTLEPAAGRCQRVNTINARCPAPRRARAAAPTTRKARGGDCGAVCAAPAALASCLRDAVLGRMRADLGAAGCRELIHWRPPPHLGAADGRHRRDATPSRRGAARDRHCCRA